MDVVRACIIWDLLSSYNDLTDCFERQDFVGGLRPYVSSYDVLELFCMVGFDFQELRVDLEE